MEIEVSSSTHDSESQVNRVDLESIRVKRKTLQNLLEDCQRALEQLNLPENSPGGDETGGFQDDNSDGVGEQSGSPDSEEFSFSDPEADKVPLRSLLRRIVDC